MIDPRRHHRPRAGDLVSRGVALFVIGMAGSSPAMTAVGVIKAGAGRRRVRDEKVCDPGQRRTPPRHHRPCAGDPDGLTRRALHIEMADHDGEDSAG
ncbi:hypothetical protein J4G37_05605 [Microvirga sp. 3-52]|nr:hypothetical protein [Microvirga sp. 3-52]